MPKVACSGAPLSRGAAQLRNRISTKRRASLFTSIDIEMADILGLACTGAPISAFQKAIRDGATTLLDHISKEMNELNMERCRCIPKLTPGADWRVLQEIVEAHPERTLYKVGDALVCRE